MVNFSTRIPHCDSHSISLVNFFLLKLVFALQWLSLHWKNFDHVAVSVSTGLPSNQKEDAPFHRRVSDCFCVNWDVVLVIIWEMFHGRIPLNLMLLCGSTGLETFVILVHESPCSSKQVQESVVRLVISCTLWLYEVHVFASSCTSSCTKWNMLWKDEAMQYFAISSLKDWKVMREKKTQTLLPTENYI